MNPFSTEGRLALVTGASRGIGRAVCHALAASGSNLILVGREHRLLEDTATALRAKGREAFVSVFDLQNTRKIEAWFADVCAMTGVPDILVNSAGISRRGSAIELSLDDWEAVMAVNATAVFELSRHFAQRLIAEKRPGRIINLASLMTTAARPATAPYTASKGGIGQLTKAFAIEWAPHHILVNAVAPGYIDTDLNEALIGDPAFDTWVKRRCPLGRWGAPEDIAWPIVFLASEAASFITGQILYADGGWLATF